MNQDESLALEASTTPTKEARESISKQVPKVVATRPKTFYELVESRVRLNYDGDVSLQNLLLPTYRRIRMR